MFRAFCRFLLLLLSVFFAPSTGTAYWQFHKQMDRSWELSDDEFDRELDAIRSVPTHEAYTVFYVQSGGNNANSGSTTGAVIWTNTVSWVGAGTSTLTVTDAGASVVAVNDYINVGGGWVSQVTAINSSGAPTYVITLSGATGWGTEPATNAAITAVDGGAWLNLTQSIITGSTTIPSSTQICVKQNGTYSNTGNVTWGLKGTASIPLWFRGYNTTIGDLEPGNAAWVTGNNSSGGLSYPTVTGTGQITNNLTYAKFTGMSFTSSVNVGAMSTGTNSQKFQNCRFANTGANAGGSAISVGSQCTFTDCYFTSTATSTTIVTQNQNAAYYGCFFAGAASGSTQCGVTCSGNNAALVVANCCISVVGSHGISMGSGVNAYLQITGNTFNQCTGDGIHIVTGGGTSSCGLIANNYFYKSGGWNVNNVTASNAGFYSLSNNCNNQATSGHTTGFGDQWELGATSAGTAALNETLTPPFVSSTDLHLLPSSVGASAGLPGQWENQASGLNSQPDVGAWQRNASGTPVGQQCL